MEEAGELEKKRGQADSPACVSFAVRGREKERIQEVLSMLAEMGKIGLQLKGQLELYDGSPFPFWLKNLEASLSESSTYRNTDHRHAT